MWEIGQATLWALVVSLLKWWFNRERNRRLLNEWLKSLANRQISTTLSIENSDRSLAVWPPQVIWASDSRLKLVAKVFFFAK